MKSKTPALHPLSRTRLNEAGVKQWLALLKGIALGVASTLLLAAVGFVLVIFLRSVWIGFLMIAAWPLAMGKLVIRTLDVIKKSDDEVRARLPGEVMLAGTSRSVAYRGHEERVALEAIHPLGTSNRYAAWVTANALVVCGVVLYANLQHYNMFVHAFMCSRTWMVESAIVCALIGVPIVARVRRYKQCARLALESTGRDGVTGELRG